MNKICLLLVLVLFPLNSVLSDESDLWMVTSHHPEVLQELQGRSIAHFDQGRVKVVELNGGVVDLSPETRNSLQPIHMSQVAVYTPQPGLVETRPRVVRLLNQVSPEKYRSYVQHLSSLPGRSSRKLTDDGGRPGNWQAVEWLQRKFQDLGLRAELHCYDERTPYSECNVVAVRPATHETTDTVLIEAHLDDVGHAQAGADDNASGAAALVAIAEALREEELNKNVVFLATNGEEEGFNGSRAYVQKLETENRLGELKLVINMDMIGYNKGNRLMEIETNREFEERAKWYADRVRAYTNLTPEITIPAWGSDHVPFLNKGIPTVLTIEDWQTKTPCYHRECDKEETINYEYAIQIVKVNLAVIAELGGL